MSVVVSCTKLLGYCNLGNSIKHWSIQAGVLTISDVAFDQMVEQHQRMPNVVQLPDVHTLCMNTRCSFGTQANHHYTVEFPALRRIVLNTAVDLDRVGDCFLQKYGPQVREVEIGENVKEWAFEPEFFSTLMKTCSNVETLSFPTHFKQIVYWCYKPIESRIEKPFPNLRLVRLHLSRDANEGDWYGVSSYLEAIVLWKRPNVQFVNKIELHGAAWASFVPDMKTHMIYWADMEGIELSCKDPAAALALKQAQGENVGDVGRDQAKIVKTWCTLASKRLAKV
ncbi:hypothetical protein DFH11DRAFT_1782575 [Phellopilus nigrolimitatus]|nr:hypothetical protein DFH11DRAFT_1782575 [Phellopilus nigrolimitatus]